MERRNGCGQGDPGATQQMVVASGARESQAQNDVTIKLEYTLNGQAAAPWQGTLSVIRPKSLTRLSNQETFSATGKDCGDGTTSYLRTLHYQINSQLSGVAISGFDAWLAESFASVSDSPTGCVKRDSKTGELILSKAKAGLQLSLGGIPDDFSFCGCDAGCAAAALQTIDVNGYNVRVNNISWTCADVNITKAATSP